MEDYPLMSLSQRWYNDSNEERSSKYTVQTFLVQTFRHVIQGLFILVKYRTDNTMSMYEF